MRRLQRGLRRYGIAGAARRALAIAVEAAYFDDTHVWYELVLAEPRPRFVLEPPLFLHRATEADLPLVDALWPVARADGRRRLEEGADLWLVLDGGMPVCSCWTFRRRVPVGMARTQWLELPRGTASFEEVVTAPGYRGRGIAPAVFSLLADGLEREGFVRVVVAPAVENAASRRAFEKVGFREIAVAHVRRRWLHTRVRVENFDPHAAAFVAELVR
jgi:RimJ/RimL family protein N-acetyltransferase